MSEVKISYDGLTATAENKPAPGQLPRFMVSFSDGSDPFAVRVLWSSMFELQLNGRLTPAELREVMVPWAATEVERRVRAGVRPPDGQYQMDIEIAWQQLDAAEALAATKQCDYQEGHRRDLFCTVSAETEEVASEQLGKRGVFPRFPCHLRQVLGAGQPVDLRTPSQPARPPFGGRNPRHGHRRCKSHLRQGSKTQFPNPRGCRAGGHGCWERVVETHNALPEKVTPRQMLEALESLVTESRLLFGKERITIKAPALNTTADMLAPCTNPADLEVRLSRLSDYLKSVQIADDLLDEKDREHPDIKPKDRTMNRLERALAHVLPPDMAQEAVPHFTVLRQLVRLRVTQQHAETATDALKVAAKLGLGWPCVDAQETWLLICSLATRAFVELRAIVRTQNL